MTEQELFNFVDLLIRSCTPQKLKNVLNQIMDILDNQGEKELLGIISNMINSIPEICEITKGEELDQSAYEIACERAKERIKREKISREYGRCR